MAQRQGSSPGTYSQLDDASREMAEVRSSVNLTAGPSDGAEPGFDGEVETSTRERRSSDTNGAIALERQKTSNSGRRVKWKQMEREIKPDATPDRPVAGNGSDGQDISQDHIEEVEGNTAEQAPLLEDPNASVGQHERTVDVNEGTGASARDVEAGQKTPPSGTTNWVMWACIAFLVPVVVISAVVAAVVVTDKN